MNLTLLDASSSESPALCSIRHFSTDQPVVYHMTPNHSFDLWLLVKGEAHIADSSATITNAPAGLLGMQTSPTRFVMQPHTAGVHLRFSPVELCQLVGLPLRELTGQPVELTDLWGQAFRDCQERIRASHSPHTQLNVVRSFLNSQLLNRDIRLTQQLTLTIANKTASASVRQLCQQTGYSERQLQRLFDNQVGMSPRTFIRVSRFQKATALFARYQLRKLPFTLLSVALDAGYYDQAHFIRDCRQFTGRTPENYFWTMDPVLSGSYNPGAGLA